MWTDQAPAGSTPARIIFPSLRSSGPAHEQAGYTEGRAAGYAAGLRAAAQEQRRWRDRMAAEQADALAAGQQDLERAAQALAAARTDFAHRNVQVLQDAEEVLVRTALELAEAILGYELAEGTRTARAVLDRALSGCEDATVVAIRLNPADLEVLAKEGHDLPAELPLAADPGLERGDARVDYQQGYLDAGLRSALERVRAALLGDQMRGGQASAGHVPGGPA